MPVSAQANLSTVSAIPPGRKVYRGIGDMVLPKCFRVRDKNGVLGGVERAFMSTTTNKRVALFYIAGRKVPTVFTIQVGAANMGAGLSYLSQFPQEEEVLMPPGSHLEIVGPAVVRDGVLEVPLQISCPQTPTVKQSRASRKTNLLGMANHTLLEIRRDLAALAEQPRAGQRAAQDFVCSWVSAMLSKVVDKPTPYSSLHNSGLVAAIEKQCTEWVQCEIEAREPAWFNEDESYRRAVAQACDLKRLALGKLEAWLEDRSVNASQVAGTTLLA